VDQDFSASMASSRRNCKDKQKFRFHFPIQFENIRDSSLPTVDDAIGSRVPMTGDILDRERKSGSLLFDGNPHVHLLLANEILVQEHN